MFSYNLDDNIVVEYIFVALNTHIDFYFYVMGDFYFINLFRLKHYFPFIDNLTETLIYRYMIGDY
mgnify:CR=1 FL=1